MPNDNKQQTTTTPPIIFTEDALPPMPDLNPANSGSAAPADDIVMPVITTSPTPKKKFAGGKVIATILGLFLLIGGVGAGTYLVQQNQDIREKAGIYSCGPGSGDGCEGKSNGDSCGGEKVCKVRESGTECSCVGPNPPATPEPTVTPTTPPLTAVPVCQSATVSKNTLTGPGDSLTISSTATTSDITGFSYGFYNLDNLYGPDNPKPIWFTANTHYVRGDTVTPINSHTITVTYDELNKPDLNWQGKPTKIQVNAFFGNSAGWNHSDAKCVVQFNITLGSTQTISCTDLTSNVANPVVGQEITGTCHGNVSGTNPSYARFAVSLNGTLLGASENIPLNSAGTASYTATVPQEGNYLVQCQICTSLSDVGQTQVCTTMGEAN